MKFLVLLSGLLAVASAAVIPRADKPQPIVVVDENGYNSALEQKSWDSVCEFDKKEGAMVCKITKNWGAFSFLTPESYKGGKLFVTMKVKNEDAIQFQTQFPAPPGYYNFHRFTCTTEYADYEKEVGNNPDYSDPVNQYAIQDASEKNNVLYIKKVIFYPPGSEEETGGNSGSGGSSSGTGSDAGTTPGGSSSGTGSDAGTTPGGPSSGTGTNTGTTPGGPSSGTGTNTGTTPSGSNTGSSPSPTKPADNDKDSGSISVKVSLFSIVLVQIIMAFVLM